MNWMKNITWQLVLGGLLWAGCYNDMGNYDYHDFNEVMISTKGFDTGYQVTSFVDTIRITPEISYKLEENKNLTYEWVAVSNGIGSDEYRISTQRNLVYPVSLPTESYALYFKVKDTLNTMEYVQVTGVEVRDLLSRGWVLLGENDEGFVQMDMLAMSGDTTLMKDIIKESGLPPLKGPVKVWVIDNYKDNMIHVSTKDGTYRLDRNTFLGGEHTHFKYAFYDPTCLKDFVLEEALQVRSYCRTAIVDGQLFHVASLIMSGMLGNPANHYKGNYDLFPIGQKLGYNPKAMSQAFIGYDCREKRFVYAGGSAWNAPQGYCDSLVDTRADIDVFSWKTGMDYVTTVNSRFLDGYTYTLLKEPGTGKYYLYSYKTVRSSYGTGITKNKRYEVVNTPDIDKAEFFGASALRTFLIYTVGSKVYAYDYNSQTAKMIKDFGEHEITCFFYDILNETGNADDFFYVCTYDPALPKSIGGTMTKFKVVDNPNEIVIEEVPGSKWTGLCKTVSIDFKKN